MVYFNAFLRFRLIIHWSVLFPFRGLYLLECSLKDWLIIRDGSKTTGLMARLSRGLIRMRSWSITKSARRSWWWVTLFSCRMKRWFLLIAYWLQRTMLSVRLISAPKLWMERGIWSQSWRLKLLKGNWSLCWNPGRSPWVILNQTKTSINITANSNVERIRMSSLWNSSYQEEPL